jgi:DNA-3-methyladenine glycosylase I
VPDPSLPRCAWVGTDPVYIAYHDDEWGVPVHEDRALFEFLVLEAFQAGLSWLTVLKKRPAFARAFADWDVKRIAGWGEAEEARLLADPGMIRNRAKVRAAIRNAGAFLRVAEAFGSFDRYLWDWTDGVTIRPARRYRTLAEMPAESDLSRRLGRDLKKRGFTFVGPVICYSYLQACGLIDDHMAGCFRAE